MLSRSSKRRSAENLEQAKETKKLITNDGDSIKSSSGGSKQSSQTRKAKVKRRTEAESNFFIVDKIIGQKTIGGVVHYRVRWQGYDESEDSWEPEKNLRNVLDLIEEYARSTESTGSCNSGGGGGPRKPRGVPGYEYVLTTEMVASKTKYFDDIRDGKIDVMKSDLYSRVKTRRRRSQDRDTESEKGLDGCPEESDNVAMLLMEDEEDIGNPGQPGNTSIVSSPFPSELDRPHLRATDDLLTNPSPSDTDPPDMLLKTHSFSKLSSSQPTYASKSSSNDDVSLFNCSICSNTNQSDDLCASTQTPTDPGPLPGPSLVTVATQTAQTGNVLQDKDEPTSSNPQTHLQPVLAKIDAARLQGCPRGRLAASETHLISIYAGQVHRQAESLTLPPLLSSTDDPQLSVSGPGQLRTAILLDCSLLLERHLSSVDGTSLQELLRTSFLDDGYSALQLAVARNRVSIVRLLLQLGAEPDHVPASEQSAVSVTPSSRPATRLSCRPDDTSSGNINGASVAAEPDAGWTPLLIAADRGHLHCVRALLDAGAHSDPRDSGGRSALYRALRGGHIAVTDMLLYHGADFVRARLDRAGVSTSALVLARSLAGSRAAAEAARAIHCHQNWVWAALDSAVDTHLRRLGLTRSSATTASLFSPLYVSTRFPGPLQLAFSLPKSPPLPPAFPLLLLAHALPADHAHLHVWLDNGPCVVSAAVLASRPLPALTRHQLPFLTALHPLLPTPAINNLEIHIDRATAARLSSRLRLAVIGIYVVAHR